jgi:8-oxo-dGTP pyrophosphatase MutT (NUDIX family)
LLVLRDDTRTWALPGGSLDLEELPTAGVIREVEEETGIKCLPVRLVGVYFMKIAGIQYLHLIFRCLVRGGALTPSAETPKVAYHYPDKIANRMLAISRERLQRGLTHAGGAPDLVKQKGNMELGLASRFLSPIVYKALALRRWWQSEPAYQPPPDWKMGVFVIVSNEKGGVLWVQSSDDGNCWNLPGGGRQEGEPPWDTAIREVREETGLTVALNDMVGFYVKPAKKEVVINFSGTVVSGKTRLNEEAIGFAYFAVGTEPENSLKSHVARVKGWAENISHGGSAPIPHMAIQ